MDKQKKEQLILLIAVVVFVIMIPQLVFKKKPGAKTLYPVAAAVPDFQKPVNAAAVSGAVNEANKASKIDNAPQQELNPAWDAEAKDPFDIPANVLEQMNMAKYREGSEGAAGESEEIAGINLQGFVWGGDSPIAFINDKSYKKGDMVGDAQILDIDKKGVILLYGGRTVLMRVKK